MSKKRGSSNEPKWSDEERKALRIAVYMLVDEHAIPPEWSDAKPKVPWLHFAPAKHWTPFTVYPVRSLDARSAARARWVQCVRYERALGGRLY